MEKEELSTEEQDIRKKIEKESKRTFYIKECPEEVWREFADFCKKEHRDDYALGLKNLLEFRKLDVKNTAIMNMIINNENEIKQIKEQIKRLTK